MRKPFFLLALAALFSACATTHQPAATPIYLYAAPSGDLATDDYAVSEIAPDDRPLYSAEGEGWYRVRLGGETLYLRSGDVRRMPRAQRPPRRAPLLPLFVAYERPAVEVASAGPADRLLVVGPRGGCYYLSGSGGKVYVPRSRCAEQATRLAENESTTDSERAKAIAPATPKSAPSYGGSTGGSGGPVRVRGYTRRDGTYVRPHTRSRPRRN
ncbi:MAG: hypothetical protein IAE99_07990 [Rhodothermales bacterium]|nr:hypothetical protein [Rhodothermales bacterium]